MKKQKLGKDLSEKLHDQMKAVLLMGGKGTVIAEVTVNGNPMEVRFTVEREFEIEKK